MKNSLENRIIVITGAGGTLCSAISRSFAKEGASVALLGRTESKVASVAEEISSAGGRALALRVDVTQLDSLLEARARIVEAWGEPDTLINGAGGKDPQAVTEPVSFTREELEGSVRGFFNLDPDALRGEVDLNLFGTIFPSQVFGRSMAAQGRGNIVNFASMTSYRPLSRVPGYALAKAGIINFTQWLAAYLAPAGVRVNAVAPGFFLNDKSRKLLLTEDGGFSPRGQQVIHHTPLGRFGEAEELVSSVRWLIDESAGFVTGITVPVDGGFLSTAGV